jgi:cytochrome c oxidase assembly factor CtaG
MTTHELLTSCWQADPIAITMCVAAAVTYAARGIRSWAHALPFAVAVIALALALMSPVGSLAEGYLFSAHMLQHLLLVLVVPPLALLGFESFSESGWTRRMPPVVAWGFGVGAMWLWHAPALCDAASQNPIVHRLQELSLLAMGGAFWWPIVGPPASGRLPPLGGVLYLFMACVACTLLGIYITFSPVEVCSVFAHPVDRLGVMPLLRDGWGLTTQKDQQVGGLLMWVPACLVYGVAILALLGRMWRDADAPTAEPKEASS